MMTMLTQKTNSAKLEPLAILEDIAEAGKSGNILVKSNLVTWQINFANGKLQSACHSLQSLATIKYFLLRHNFRETAKEISKHSLDIEQINKSVLSLIQQLEAKNLLSSGQKSILLKELSQEAIEFFLWLQEGEYQETLNNSAYLNQTNELWDIPALVTSLKLRLKVWQQLNPLIKSPLQRPFCLKPELLSQPVPQGKLSPAILEKLFKRMRGATIHEIALVLKESDLKTAQLLLPYIKAKAVVVQNPKAPFHKLPLIPPITAPTSEQSNSVEVENKKSTTIERKTQPQVVPPVKKDPANVASTPTESSVVETKPVQNSNNQVSQATYKIVSIDDSQTMLDTIKSYLGTDQYEVSTLENPMLSLGILFDIKPDLILMDFSMPGINGNKLCQILRKSHVFAQTPIIMVSGNMQMIKEENLQISGITDYLAKPFSREDLLAIVEKHLKK